MGYYWPFGLSRNPNNVNRNTITAITAVVALTIVAAAANQPLFEVKDENEDLTFQIKGNGDMSSSGTTQFNDVTYTWPSAQGTADQVISNDGTGVFSWVNQTGGGGGAGTSMGTGNVLDLAYYTGEISLSGSGLRRIANGSLSGTNIFMDSTVSGQTLHATTLITGSGGASIDGDAFFQSTIFTSIGLDAIGAVDMDYGSADVTDHTFLSDGTGTAEFVLVAGAIDGTEILDDTILVAEFGDEDWGDVSVAVNAVTLDTGVVDSDALAANSVDSSELVDGGVDLSHMSSASVDSDNIVDATIDFVDIKYDNTLAGNPALAVDECFFIATAAGGGFICEGSTANTNEQIYQFPDVDGADTTNFICVDNTEVTSIDGDGLTITSGTLDADLGTTIVTGEITDGTILEIDMDVSNAPTDNYIMTFNNAGSNFTWIETIPIANGGTNQTSAAVPGAVVYSTSSAMAFTADSSSGTVLIFQGVGAPISSSGALKTSFGMGNIGLNGAGVTTGTGQITPIIMPFAMTNIDIELIVDLAPVGAALQVRILVDGTDILSTDAEIDAGAVRDDNNHVFTTTNIANGAIVQFDIVQAGSSGNGTGMTIQIIGFKTP